MKRITTVILLAGFLQVNSSVANACGDKALRIGRGIRFQRPARPVSILIYIPANSLRAAQLQSVLKKVGHKPSTVQSAERLREALQSGQFELVFADLAEAANLGKQISSSSSKPVLVPVVSQGTKAEVAAARKQYKNFVKDPHSADRYLTAIEEAMRSRVHLLAKKV